MIKKRIEQEVKPGEAFQLDETRQWNIDDILSWQKEADIESIIEKLMVLDATEEGKSIVVNLSEVLNYTEDNKVGQLKFGKRFQNLRKDIA